jgi:hypothetical protein
LLFEAEVRLAPDEQQAMSESCNAWPLDSAHYREVAARLRDIAAECRFKGEQNEFSQLAELFQRRAAQLRSPIAGAPNAADNEAMTLDLTNAEKLALVTELRRTIDKDRYPLSPRIQTLKAILAKLEPSASVAEPLPPPKRYAPPQAKRRARK